MQTTGKNKIPCSRDWKIIILRQSLPAFGFFYQLFPSTTNYQSSRAMARWKRERLEKVRTFYQPCPPNR